MKKLILLFLAICSVEIFAQKPQYIKPDYDKIEKNIKDKASPYFYSKLMDRYLRGDTAMSIDLKQHLYYGYAFQDAYAPYGASRFLDSLKPILEQKVIPESDYPKILMFSDSLLKKNPFDMRALNYQSYVYEKTKKIELFTKCMSRIQVVIDAIASTGDGTSKENALYVIYITHEYDMLDIWGIQFGGKQSLEGHYDRLTLAKNDAGIEAMYFDVSASLNHMSKMFQKNK